MNVIGIEKSSFIDYPRNICTVLFTGGCNFRCSYCHNSPIVNNIGDKISEEEIIAFLKKRKRFVDAVCISGGEPTLQSNLYEFVERLKKEKFLIKLDTNGSNPDILERLINSGLVDYVAMDIKAPLDKYESITKSVVNIEDIKKSIETLLKNKVEYEFRTTICRELLNIEDIKSIAQEIKGCRVFAIQNFRDGDTVLAGSNKFTSYTDEELKYIEQEVSSLLENVIIR